MLHEHEMLYLLVFCSLPGGDNFPSTGSKHALEMLRKCSENAPGDAPGSLARVSNVYCLMFGEPLVFGGACSRPPWPEVGGVLEGMLF